MTPLKKERKKNKRIFFIFFFAVFGILLLNIPIFFFSHANSFFLMQNKRFASLPFDSLFKLSGDDTSHKFCWHKFCLNFLMTITYVDR